MKIYTYSHTRQKLADVLEESKTEEVIIRRRKGDLFSIVPKSLSSHSPFEVPGLKKRISRREILESLCESRRKKYSL